MRREILNALVCNDGTEVARQGVAPLGATVSSQSGGDVHSFVGAALMKRLFWLGLTTAAVMFVAVPQAQASAVLPLVLNNNLPANDDGSTGVVPIGFTINFFGVNFSTLFVNNNGNVTFNNPLGQFTPTGITAGSQPTMAPFWADVDTRPVQVGPPTNLVTYGNGLVNGHNAFAVDWVGVGFALVAAVCWGCYILLTQRVGDAVAGINGLAVSMGTAAVVSTTIRFAFGVSSGFVVPSGTVS